MEEENKLTLINCKEWELPVLQERKKLNEEIKNPKNYIKFDFTKYIQAEYRDIFADFFAGLKPFVQYTRGTQMNIRISNGGQLLVEIEAVENEMENIIKSFQEYIIQILPIIKGQKPEITSTLDNSNAAFIFLQNKVNSLDIQLQIYDQKFINQNQKE